MKWLTLEQIKQQLRIEQDFTDEDGLLEMYADSAEDTVLNICQRTYEDMVDSFGGIPQPIVEASLLLVAMSYEHRSPASQYQMYAVGYAFDMRIKPYMRLTAGSSIPTQVVILGSQIKIAFTADLPDDLTLRDVDFSGQVLNVSDAEVSVDFVKSDCVMMDDGKWYAVFVNTDDLGVGAYMLKMAVDIPDTDYPSGYRREVVKFNPHIVVKK